MILGTHVNKSITSNTTNNSNTNPKYTEVQNEYINQATPGKGTLTLDDKCIKQPDYYKDEINFANWLHSTLGGDIQVLEEKKIKGQPDPDFLWNGKLWDLKTISSEKAANTAIQRGHKQIKSNPGGVMLNFNNYNYDYDKLINVINDRMKWYYGTTDIMIVKDGKIKKILRYKK